MAFEVYVSDEATRNLDALASYIKADSSVEAATAWFAGIVDAIRSLSSMPERFPIAAESNEIGEQVRLLVHGKRNRRYKIYYSVHRRTAKSGAVHILHVRHYSRRRPNAEELQRVLHEI